MYSPPEFFGEHSNTNTENLQTILEVWEEKQNVLKDLDGKVLEAITKHPLKRNVKYT
jgi:hypothetical protein